MTLKARLKDLGLRRRGGYLSPTEVRRAIVSELRGPGQLFGYRTMWLTLKQKHGLCVKRETVMRMLRKLNPRGSLSRTRLRFIRCTYHSMGPNYLWHIDWYDKLKLFGMTISGCIDGFSRRIMWLKCGPTNNNPEVIKNNFIDCIRLWFATHHVTHWFKCMFVKWTYVISWCGWRQAASFASYVEMSPFYKKLFPRLNYSSGTTSSQNLSAAAKTLTWLKRSNVCTAKSQAGKVM